MRNNILITGASSGLGYGMALEFARRGRNLALCARREDRLAELKAAIAAINPNLTVICKALDVNDHDEVFRVFKAFDEEIGGLDRIIVNAGMGKGATIGSGYFYANKQTATTNFVSALAQMEAAMEIFNTRNAGHLVTISSVSAVSPYRRALTVYAASKAALTSMTQGLAIDLMDSPIKVTALHPGFIKSEINEKVKKVPFIVDTETGCRAMVNAMEKEGKSYFVPTWPWAFLQLLLRIAPASLLKKMS